MGRATDIVVAVIALIVGIWILSRLGLDMGSIWNLFKSFFSSNSGSSGNTTSAGLIFGIASNSRARNKIRKKTENIRRMIFSRRMKNEQKAVDGRGHFEK